MNGIMGLMGTLGYLDHPQRGGVQNSQGDFFSYSQLANNQRETAMMAALRAAQSAQYSTQPFPPTLNPSPETCWGCGAMAQQNHPCEYCGGTRRAKN